MPRFCALASGSSGNCVFVETIGVGLLIDLGLNPRTISSRLAAIGASWERVHAAVLTHVHGDHWKERTLAHLHSRKVPLFGHPQHLERLLECSAVAGPMQKAGLLRSFEAGERFEVRNSLTCLPVPVPHDCDPTFAFRIDGRSGLFSEPWSLGYASDLGVTPTALIEQFRDVELLALEFNHDVEMQKRSGRPHHLIERVLGDRGHLSNVQAAETLRAILNNESGPRLRHVVQLHLSHQCNRPELARRAAADVIKSMKRSVAVHTSAQDRTTAFIEIAA